MFVRFNPLCAGTHALMLAALLAIFSAAVPDTTWAAEMQKPAPQGLMVELMAEPWKSAIFDPKPEFGWIIPVTQRGDKQSAYRILVASLPELLAGDSVDLWDSGKVAGDASVAVEYGGAPLESGRSYYWKVRTWNREGEPSEWSGPQEFRTGALEPVDAVRRVTPRYPLVEAVAEPVRKSRTKTGIYFFDFGKDAFGTVLLHISNRGEARTLKVRLGEKEEPHGKVSMYPGGSVLYREMALDVSPGENVYRLAIPPNARNTATGAIRMPDYTGEVMPFRYCEVHAGSSSIEVMDAKQVRVSYPYNAEASAFESSDTVLNDVWELCKYSTFATTFGDVFADGDRERIPYEADSYINQLSHYSLDREYTIARYSHEYMITHPTWPTEWVLHSVLMAWADYLYTGDAESLRGYYDDLKAKTLLALARADGLISTSAAPVPPGLISALHMDNPEYPHSRALVDIVDWPDCERDGYVFSDYNTVVNAFHYQTMNLMSKIASALGRGDDAKFYTGRAELVKNSFNRAFLSTSTGIYVDGEGAGHSSLHANLFALAFGLVPDERRAAVVEFVKSRGMACSVYAAQYLLDALFDAGEDEFALRLMTDKTSGRSWPHMIYDVGATMTLEAWDRKYKPNLDWNHPWGAAPANIIPRKLMGIEPLEPGFKKVRIRPACAGLEQAKITEPTIRGPIELQCGASGGRREYRMCLPGNMQAEVQLPATRREDVLESGVPADTSPGVAFLRAGDGRIVFSVESGCYDFTVK